MEIFAFLLAFLFVCVIALIKQQSKAASPEARFAQRLRHGMQQCDASREALERDPNYQRYTAQVAVPEGDFEAEVRAVGDLMAKEKMETLSDRAYELEEQLRTDPEFRRKTTTEVWKAALGRGTVDPMLAKLLRYINATETKSVDDAGRYDADLHEFNMRSQVNTHALLFTLGEDTEEEEAFYKRLEQAVYELCALFPSAIEDKPMWEASRIFSAASKKRSEARQRDLAARRKALDEKLAARAAAAAKAAPVPVAAATDPDAKYRPPG